MSSIILPKAACDRQVKTINFQNNSIKIKRPCLLIKKDFLNIYIFMRLTENTALNLGLFFI